MVGALCVPGSSSPTKEVTMASMVVSACVLLTLLALNLSGPAIAQQDQGVELVSQIGGGANGVAIHGPTPT